MGFLRPETRSEKGKQMRVSADKSFVVIFVPCCVEFFDLYDVLCFTAQ